MSAFGPLRHLARDSDSVAIGRQADIARHRKSVASDP